MAVTTPTLNSQNASNENAANDDNTTTPSNNDNTTTTPSNNNPAPDDDTTYPVVTILDNNEKPFRKPRSACGCLPERTVVIAILSVYFFFGIVQAASYISDLIQSHSLIDQIMSSFETAIVIMLAAAGAVGMNAVYKERAKLMRHLSILFIVLTFAMFSLNVANYAMDVAGRDDLVEECKQEIIEEGGDISLTNCGQIVNMFLTREGLSLVFFEALKIYFAYVIFRHARDMSSKQRYPYPLARDGDLPPTYFVYASNGVPTADNWVPPPTYNGNPNNIPIAEDNKFVNNAENHA